MYNYTYSVAFHMIQDVIHVFNNVKGMPSRFKILRRFQDINSGCADTLPNGSARSFHIGANMDVNPVSAEAAAI